MQPLPNRQNDRMMFFYHIYVYHKYLYTTNEQQIIPLTYLLHHYCAFVIINIISGLARVISKVLITAHQHIHCVFQFYYFPYHFPTRVLPRHGWRWGTICLTRQFHSLSNPRLKRCRSDRLHCSCVCKI